MEHDLALGERLEITIGGRGCISDVQGVSTRGNPVISLPMYRITTVPLKGGETLQISYFRENGIYSFLAKVLRRMHDGALELLEIEIKSPTSHHQRRESIRVDMAVPLDVRLIALPEHILQHSNDEILRLLCDARFAGIPRPPIEGEEIYRCQTLDLSSGGARFMSQQKWKRGSLLECTFHLEGREDISADGQILRAEQYVGRVTNWQVGVQFVNVDERIRRRFIKYIQDQMAG
ncbi:MAG: flagellar brake protein [Oscillospiraceae bacterium]|nr:flagellar brake protein [Oscillospiraceae bacterium]